MNPHQAAVFVTLFCGVSIFHLFLLFWINGDTVNISNQLKRIATALEKLAAEDEKEKR